MSKRVMTHEEFMQLDVERQFKNALFHINLQLTSLVPEEFIHITFASPKAHAIGWWSKFGMDVKWEVSRALEKAGWIVSNLKVEPKESKNDHTTSVDALY
ncbi:hypothetical protein DFJ77DRAFT_509499 [Powellomyces hirtus]|nr:hypothetical protein DFJ77DRAFT_509499 [Powellomyces hirtus]